MKSIALILIAAVLTGLISCSHSSPEINKLQNRINNLEAKLAKSYKPGFGEMMNSIQSHHLKLWYAGLNKNWKLAEFEVKEFGEVVENIGKFQSERKETGLINMMEPALDSLLTAIGKQDGEMFVESYTGLTNSCNSCHRLTDFEFNRVKVPDGKSPFMNQDFKPEK